MKKIVIAGGTGFLGQVLIKHLTPEYRITVLTRSIPAPKNYVKYVSWDATSVGHWCRELEDADVLINLVGKSVNCRYTEKNRNLITNSRVDATHVLGQAIKMCGCRPDVWINASSATIYKGTYGPPNDEYNHQIGEGFSVGVCKEWESAFNRYECEGRDLRKVALRTTIVLGKGSALSVLNRLARLGLGGAQGGGQQFFSWIHEYDFVQLVKEVIQDKTIRGPVNAAAPNPVTNATFMRALRKSLGVTFGLPQTKCMVKLGAFVMGTEAELVLKSRHVVSEKLRQTGFQFEYPTIETALNQLNKK